MRVESKYDTDLRDRGTEVQRFIRGCGFLSGGGSLVFCHYLCQRNVHNTTVGLVSMGGFSGMHWCGHLNPLTGSFTHSCSDSATSIRCRISSSTEARWPIWVVFALCALHESVPHNAPWLRACVVHVVPVVCIRSICSLLPSVRALICSDSLSFHQNQSLLMERLQK